MRPFINLWSTILIGIILIGIVILSGCASTNESKICDKIQEDSAKNECYETLAVQSNDVAFCDKITSGSFSDLSRNICYTHVAMNSGDPEVCKKVQSPYERDCYIELAKITKDPSLCDYAKLKYNYCIAEVVTVVPDESLCERISGTVTEGKCYENLAVAKKDHSFCNKMPLDEYGKNKSDSCIFSVAATKQDKETCKKITHPVIQSNCLKELTRKEEEKSQPEIKVTPNICNDEENLISKGECYYKLAQETGNPTWCESITAYEQTLVDIRKASCYLNLGKLMKDTSICKMITNIRNDQLIIGGYVGACYNINEEIEEGASMCNTLKKQSDKDACNKALVRKEHPDYMFKP